MCRGLSMPFGNGPATADGWRRDHPSAPLDLAPAVITDDDVCGAYSHTISHI
jgi:hypothetical protein